MGLVQPDRFPPAAAPGGADHRRVRLQLFAEERNGDVGIGPVLFVAGRPGEAGAKQGLEVSVLGIVATGSCRAFGIDATQTPPDLSTDQAAGYSRVDVYLEQIVDLYDQLAGLGVSYWVGDGFYAKQKVIDTVTGLGGDLITRLRSDANLRHLYSGPPKDGPGAPKQYDGKIAWDDQAALSQRFDELRPFSLINRLRCSLAHLTIRLTRLSFAYWHFDDPIKMNATSSPVSPL